MSTRLVAAALAVLVLVAALLLVFQSDTPQADDAEAVDVAAATEPDAPSFAVEKPSVPERREEATAAPVVPDGPPSEYTTSLGGLIGRVLDVDRSPEPDMRVELLGGNLFDFLPSPDAWFADGIPEVTFRVAETRTDDEGRFRFEGVDPHGYHALALGHGGPHSTFRVVDATPNPGEWVDLGDFLLDPYAVFIGRVVDEDESPVAGARVRASNLPTVAFTFGLGNLAPGCGVAGKPPETDDWLYYRFPSLLNSVIGRIPYAETITAADGTFRLEGVPLGTPTLLVDAEGLLPRVKGPIPTGVGGEQDLSDITLFYGDDLTVRVVETVDGEERPVAGAEVMAGEIIALYPVALMEPYGKTDASGVVVAPALPDAAHAVAIRGPRHSRWHIEHDVYPGSELVVRLSETVSLTVIARDIAGEVIPRPRVLVRDDDAISRDFDGGLTAKLLLAPPLPVADRTRFDADGAVVIEGLSAAPVEVMVRADGFAIATAKVDLSEGAGRVEVTLEREQQGTVRVIDRDGDPVRHALVGVYPSGSDDLEIAPTVSRRSDENGVAVLPGLAAGEHRVRVFHPAYAVAGATLVVPGPAVDVTLVRGGSIAGRVTAGGQPVDGSRTVIAYSDGGNVFPRAALTDADGAFRIHNLIPGEYGVMVTQRFADLMQSLDGAESAFGPAGLFMAARVETDADGNVVDNGDDLGGMLGPDASRSCVVAEGEETWLDIDVLRMEGDEPRARVVGRVTLNGRPGGGLRVATASGEATDTDGAGRFDLGEVPAGKTSVVVRQSSGDVLARRRVELLQDETRDLTIEIDAGSVRGQVRAERDGAPLAFADVRLVRVRDDENPDDYSAAMSTSTGQDGRFALEQVPVGRYLVTASRVGFATAKDGPIQVDARGSAEWVELRLQSAVTVEGVVVLSSGAEDSGFVYLLLEQDNGQFAGLFPVDHDTMRFRAEGVAPGDYKVRVLGGGDYAPLPLRVPSNDLMGAVLRPEPK